MEIAALIVAAVGVVIAWLAYKAQKAAMTRTADARLWKELEPDIVQAYVTLRNQGRTEAVIDKIEVTSPKGAKVAWHVTRDQFPNSSSLDDPNITSVHDTLIIAKPGQSVGCGMMIRLPRRYDQIEEVRFRCRLAASDQWRRYRWLPARALISSAMLGDRLVKAKFPAP